MFAGRGKKSVWGLTASDTFGEELSLCICKMGP